MKIDISSVKWIYKVFEVVNSFFIYNVNFDIKFYMLIYNY